MVKKFFLSYFICLILCSCSRHYINRIESTPDTNSYKVVDIKKENSWYFIYFQRNDSLFKVVSYQPGFTSTLNGRYRQIEKGKRYNLHLHSFREEAKMNGVYYWPEGHITGVQLDGETSVTLEPKNGILDLYRAEELAGLYYLHSR